MFLLIEIMSVFLHPIVYCECCKCSRVTSSHISTSEKKSLSTNPKNEFTLESLKDKKVDDVINKHGLKTYSEIIINILKSNYRWELFNSYGSFKRYRVNNAKNKKREKYNRNKRILRWLATTLSYMNLEQPNTDTLDEVQCYFYNNEIYISANSNEKTKKLMTYSTEGKTLIQKINDFIKEKAIEFKKTDDKNVEDDINIRKNRHVIYLKNSIENGEDNDVIKAISADNLNFVIPDSKLIDDKLHCERKIFEYLKKEFNITAFEYNNLGGIRRPCACCWNYLFSNTRYSNSGVLWSDPNAFINTEKDLTISEFVNRFATVTYRPFICDCQSCDEDE